MKSHFALLGVLCAHVLARDESNKLLDATATSTGATGNKSPKNGFTRAASAVVVVTAQPSQSNGASIMSSCSGGTTDEIPVGLQGILAKNGMEYVFLPLGADDQAACFEGYNNRALQASDLVSCCDAAAEAKFNSFRFDGGVCTGFTAWLSPTDTECYAENINEPGLYIAKKKLSNFTSTAPTFNTSSSLKLARIVVDVNNIVDGCPYSKTLKITTYSKTKTESLEYLISEGGSYDAYFYIPELCDDNASADKRTVTVSIIDGDGSVLASVTEVTSSGFTGRHLLSNGVCVLYSGSPLQTSLAANECHFNLSSLKAFEDGFLSLAYLRQELARLNVNVVDFWTSAWYFGSTWLWPASYSKINMSLFNNLSLANQAQSKPQAIVNVTDWLLYVVNPAELHSTLCIDAPYLLF